MPFTFLLLDEAVQDSDGFLELSEKYRTGFYLTIDILPVPDTHHLNVFCTSINLVNDAVIADTDAPIILGTCSLAAPLRFRVLGQLPILRESHTLG